MLYPRENRVRGVIDLGGVWNFKLGDEKEPGDSFVMGEDTELMAVPASMMLWLRMVTIPNV